MMVVKIVCKKPGCGTLLADLGPGIKTTEDEYVEVPACWRCAKKRGERPGRDFWRFVGLQQRRGNAGPYTLTVAHKVPVAHLRELIAEADHLPVKVPL